MLKKLVVMLPKFKVEEDPKLRVKRGCSTTRRTMQRQTVEQEAKERLPKTMEETLQAVDTECNLLCLYCSNKVKKGLKAGVW